MNLKDACRIYPVGAKVKIADSGATYSLYEEWANEHLTNDEFFEWKRRAQVRNGSTGEIVAIDKHSPMTSDLIIAAVRILSGGEGIVLVGIEGIVPLSSSDVCSCEVADGLLLLNGSKLFLRQNGKETCRDVSGLIEEMREDLNPPLEVCSRVEIVNPDAAYPCYDDWIKAYCPVELATRFDYGRDPAKGSVGRIILIQPHLEAHARMLHLVEIHDDDQDCERLYLLEAEGLRAL